MAADDLSRMLYPGANLLILLSERMARDSPLGDLLWQAVREMQSFGRKDKEHLTGLVFGK